jgi:predicted nucleic acid-binding protein
MPAKPTRTHPPTSPRVFVDADVLFAGSAAPSTNSASLVVLRLAEITLIEAFASQQVIAEAERNLQAKLPSALPAFRLIVARSLEIVADPAPVDLAPWTECAHPKDLPILVTALHAECPWLVTYNVRHYQPDHQKVTVLRPGEFLQRVRDQLAQLGRKR